MYGGLCAGGLGTDGMFEVLIRPEGLDRLTVVVVVVVGHVDTAVDGMEHPMSIFQYFLLFCDLPTSLLGKLVLPYCGQGIRVSLFMAFLIFFFVISYFLPDGRKGFHLPAPGAI